MQADITSRRQGFHEHVGRHHQQNTERLDLALAPRLSLFPENASPVMNQSDNQFNILSQTIFFKFHLKIRLFFSTYKSFAINFMAKYKNLMSAYFILGWEKFCYRKTLYRKSVALSSKTSCGKVHSLHAFNTECTEGAKLAWGDQGPCSLRLCLVFFDSFCLLLFEMEIIFI